MSEPPTVEGEVVTTRVVTCPHCRQENVVYEAWLEEDDYLVECAYCGEILDLKVEGAIDVPLS